MFPFFLFHFNKYLWYIYLYVCKCSYNNNFFIDMFKYKIVLKNMIYDIKMIS